MITNQVRCGIGIQPRHSRRIQWQSKIITYTGQKPPYGYVDWWPISLYLNNDVKPFDDKDVRWRYRTHIDRGILIDVGYLGAARSRSLPMPDYLPLRPYFDS